MHREERQLYNFIDKFKHHIQDFLILKPTAISNFNHLSDRILDKRCGCFDLFRKNVKSMIKDSIPMNAHGQDILEKLQEFVDKGKNIDDFINYVYWIYEDW